MRKIRITGRFYVFLAMLAIGLFFIAREFVSTGATEAIVTTGNSPLTASMDAVIIRDESVASYEGEGRIEYLVDEGAQVIKGEAIANLYTANYLTKSFAQLESVRADIRSYYQKLLSGIIDSELDRLEGNVQAQALEMKKMVQEKQIGNLANVEKALEQTMKERQEYLASKRRDEQKLNDYYYQESRLLTSIQSSRQVKSADKDGVVSFYLDGYERQLTPDKIAELTSEQIATVIQGKPLAAQKTSNARLTKDVFKVASTDKWYVLLVSNAPGWNPIKDQVFQMQMEGVSGFAFVGTVTAVKKSQGEVIATVEVESPIGPMLSRRSGKMNIAAQLTGFTVPKSAIADQNGQTVVWIKDAAGTTAVAVEVLLMDDNRALIQPLTEGTLLKGQVVELQ